MPKRSKQTGVAIERQVHKFNQSGKVVEVAAIIAETPEAWDGCPESRQSEWSAVRTTQGGYLALRLIS